MPRLTVHFGHNADKICYHKEMFISKQGGKIKVADVSVMTKVLGARTFTANGSIKRACELTIFDSQVAVSEAVRH